MLQSLDSRIPGRVIRLAAVSVLFSILLAISQQVSAASIPGVGEVPEIPAFLPTMETVPPTQPMPIDGTWSIREISKTVRIDRGRVYAVDSWTHMFVLRIQPGMVVIKDLRATGPGEYSGYDLPLQGVGTYRLTRDRTLAVDVQGMLGPVRLTLMPLQLDNADWYAQSLAEAGMGAGVGSQGYQQPPQGYQQPPPPAASGGVGVKGSGSYMRSSHSSTPIQTHNDSFGPPIVEQCGVAGGAPCADENIAALPGGDKIKGACLGSNIYFTPHNGGECWTCPSGYKRRTTPIWKQTDACVERGTVWGDKANSIFSHSIWGCRANEFESRGSCYVCPEGSEKRSWLGMNPPSKPCKTTNYCEDGLVIANRPPKKFELGPPIRDFCAPPFSLAGEAGSKLHEAYFPPISSAVDEFAIQLVGSAGSGVRDALGDEDYPRAWTALNQMSNFQALRQLAERYGFVSITVGFTVDVQVGVGGNYEKGIAVSPTGYSGYTSSGLSKGLSFGGDVGYTVGVWQSEHNQLSGYAQGLVLAHAAANTGAWYSYYPEEFLGLTFGMGVGVGAEVGEINSVYTHY